MIETTLSTEYVRGTNVAGDMASADWRFLLPSLHVRRVLCVGVPSSTSLSVLSTLGEHVHIVDGEESALQAVRAACEAADLDHVEIHSVQDIRTLPFEDAHFEIIRIANEELTRQCLNDRCVQDELERVLADGGVLNYELLTRRAHRTNRRVVAHLQKRGLSALRTCWLTPLSGEMRTAVPINDEPISYFFFKNVMFGQSVKKRAMSAAGRALSRIGVMGSVAPRRAVFLQKGAAPSTADAPPEFIVTLADRAGVDLHRMRCGLSARGKYNSNKVIYYLFENRDTVPGAVVKMTRAPEFNYRLHNEFRSLKTLADGAFVPAGSYPEALFFDEHGGLALLAQKAVHGEPFRARTTARPDCPIAGEAIEWLLQIAANSAHDNLVSGPEVAAGLQTLFERFCANYALTRDEMKFMREELATLAGHSGAFPLVFQHGDPGTWNILVLPDDKVCFIDWEAGEPHGLPLWDMFYFLQTFASWVERQRGSTDALRNFGHSFLADSPFVDLTSRIVRDYCQRIGLAVEMVRPLFYTCWMHRALKQSTRLSRDVLSEGHYFNLLKLCIAQRESAALQRLFLPHAG